MLLKHERCFVSKNLIANSPQMFFQLRDNFAPITFDIDLAKN